MKNPKEYVLVEGQFNAEEAREVLLNLVRYKIQFHSLKIFEKEERYGQKDEYCTKRIKELSQTRKELQDLIALAEDGNKRFAIHSTIQVEMLN